MYFPKGVDIRIKGTINIMPICRKSSFTTGEHNIPGFFPFNKLPFLVLIILRVEKDIFISVRGNIAVYRQLHDVLFNRKTILIEDQRVIIESILNSKMRKDSGWDNG